MQSPEAESVLYRGGGGGQLIPGSIKVTLSRNPDNARRYKVQLALSLSLTLGV